MRGDPGYERKLQRLASQVKLGVAQRGCGQAQVSLNRKAYRRAVQTQKLLRS